MKTTVMSTSFVSAVKAATLGTYQSRRGCPILACVQIEADGGGVTVTGTDLSHRVSAWCGARETTDGAVTVNARALLGALPTGRTDEPVTLEADGGHLRVTRRAGAASIPICPDEFPLPLHVGEILAHTTLSGAEFRRLLGVVYAADSRGYYRPVLANIPFTLRDGSAETVAIDTHRLAFAEAHCDTVGSASILLPSTTVTALAKLRAATVRVVIGNGLAEFVGADWRVVVRQSEGAYPDWRQIIPSRATITATVDAAALAAAAETVGTRDTVLTRMALTTDRVVLQHLDYEAGQHVAEVEAMASGSMEVGINWRYLRDAARHLVGTAELLLGGRDRPVVLRTAHDMALVMPMQIA